jgi:hypothetical protein
MTNDVDWSGKRKIIRDNMERGTWVEPNILKQYRIDTNSCFDSESFRNILEPQLLEYIMFLEKKVLDLTTQVAKLEFEK